MNKKWECHQGNEGIVNKIIKENGISSLLAKILANKNIITKQEINLFLNPTRNDLHDPFLLPDMPKAVDRILEAIKNNENILIYGDYDVDGITSVTLLKKFFKDRKIDVNYYIPNRLNEGYGLNKEAIDKIVAGGNTLMITVDCGITGNLEIDYAKSLGLDTIVTDHHEPTEILPNALAVVDAKRKDNIYPFRELAGVGVSFKLIQALSQKLGLEEKEYLKYLDIVCIGTISDIVPLIDENRVITKLGLKLVKQTKNIGLKALIEISDYKEIDSITISFGIAPRINACGRMGKEKEALDLFLTENEDEARKIAQRLNEYNKKRQEIEKQIYEEAIEQIESEKEEKQVLILGHENWHHGVIGIVSSKITERYFKPSILICFEEDNAVGSRKKHTRF